MKISCGQKSLKDLAATDLTFVLLREPDNWDNCGDIDILVCDLGELDRTALKLGYSLFSSTELNRKYLKYEEGYGQWTHLDAVSRIKFFNTISPKEVCDSVLRSSRKGPDGIPRLETTDEAILLLFHAALNKGCLGPKYRSRILQADLPAMMERGDLFSVLPNPLEYYLLILDEVRQGKRTDADAVRSIQSTFSRPRSIRKAIFYRLFKRLRQLLRGNRAILFLGPDGAGKSTIIGALSKLQWPPTRLQYMGPARTAEMRRIFQVLIGFFDRTRKRHSKTNPIGIVARVGWQVTCYIDFLDRLYRHMWFWGSGGMVLFDRYACDMYFRKPTRLNEFLFLKLFPKPMFVFLCVGDAEEIYARKPEEVSPKQIKSTISLYRRKLVQYKIPHLELNTTKNKPAILIQEVVEKLDFYSNKGKF